MFWHNFKYSLKILLRDRALIFWTLAFPLILATFFQLAFSNIEQSEKLDLIKIAVVPSNAIVEPAREAPNQAEAAKQTEVTKGSAVQAPEDGPNSQAALQEKMILQALEVLSTEGEQQLFQSQIVDQKAAEQLLQDEEIIGYVEFIDGQPRIVAHTSSVDVTILQLAVERIQDQVAISTAISQAAPEKLAELAQAEVANLRDASPKHLSYTMIEFYTLIAMTCIYGGTLSMAAINHLLANMSASGKRIAVSPTPKLKLLSSNLLASYLVQVTGLALLFIYTAVFLKVDYGDNLPMIILLALVGSLCGLAFGAMIASVFRWSENSKVGVIIAFAMLGCFFAGMMGVTMKYVIDTNLPVLNHLNPANLITDGLYALYYYGVAERFWGNVVTLLIITVVIIGISAHALRREQYDNL